MSNLHTEAETLIARGFSPQRRRDVLLFLNDLPRWCRRHALTRTTALQQAREQLQAVVGEILRLREVQTRLGVRVRVSRSITRRDASELLLGREGLAAAKRAGGRVALRRDGTALYAGDGPATFPSRLTKAAVWKRLEGLRLSPSERAALQGVVALLVKRQDAPLALCRTCGRRWLVRRGRTLDCAECRQRESPWTRSRGAARRVRRPTSYQEATAQALRQLKRQRRRLLPAGYWARKRLERQRSVKNPPGR